MYVCMCVCVGACVHLAVLLRTLAATLASAALCLAWVWSNAPACHRTPPPPSTPHNQPTYVLCVSLPVHACNIVTADSTPLRSNTENTRMGWCSRSRTVGGGFCRCTSCTLVIQAVIFFGCLSACSIDLTATGAKCACLAWRRRNRSSEVGSD